MILYFTGTGNSRHVAKLLAAALDDELVSINAYLQAGRPGAFASDRPYVFVAPTYAWQLPHVVQEFLRKAAFSGSSDAYFVLTCGDGVGNAAQGARKLCRKAGLRFCGLAPVVMPENYIALYPVPYEEEAREIIDAADPAIDAVAACIREGRELPAQSINLSGRLKSSAVNAAFYAFVVSDRGFRSTYTCVGCGDCASLCPLNNISMQEGKPVWNGNCTHCMSCICACPTGAIEYRDKTQGRPRYYLDD